MSKQTGLRLLVIFMGGVLILRITAVLLANYPSIWDDAYMFIRYADNLLHDGVLAWDPGGPPVYGLTTPLYLVVVVPLRVLAADNAALAILLSSFLSGLLFIGLLAFLLLRYVDAGQTGRLLLLSGIFWALAITLDYTARTFADWTDFTLANHLAQHFLSGMDTMFVLAYLTLYLIAAKQHERSGTAVSAIVLGVTGGLSYLTRPDLLIFTLTIPFFLILLATDRSRRRRAGTALAITAVMAGLEIILAAFYFDSAHPTLISGFPLPFFAKGLHGYGPAFAQSYRAVPLKQFVGFFVSYWYLFLLIGAAVALHLARRRKPRRAADVGMLAAALLFLAYYLFFVLQIMADSHRFYYPTLPVLIFLAAQSILFLAGELPQEAQTNLQGFVAALPRFYTVLALLLMLGPLLALTPIFKDSVDRIADLESMRMWRDFPFLSKDVEDNYQAYFRNRWFALDQFSTLADELVMATTEVGHPAAMNPGKRVIDISGLNDKSIAHEGFSAALLIDRYAPDLLYMPHPDYEEMIAEIERYPAFQTEYEYITRKDLGGNFVMAIALRRDSPFYGQMREIARRNFARLEP